MEQTRKYMLVDPDAAARFGSRQPTEHESAMDREMQAVLDSKADAYEKWMRYRQTLQRYLQYQSEQRKPLSLEFAESGEAPEFEHILRTVPKTLRDRTELLVKHLYAAGIKWNERGEMVADGETLANTNYVDLINDVARRRVNFNPQGRARLKLFISRLNIPQEWIGNTYYQANGASQQQRTPGESRRFPDNRPIIATPTPRVSPQASTSPLDTPRARRFLGAGEP